MILPQARSSLRPTRTPFWVQRLYEVPVATRTKDEWLILRHDDLPTLPLHELLRHLRLIQMRLDLDPNAPPWLRERQAAIDAERRRRERSR